MSTALMIRVEALEKRVAELERIVGEATSVGSYSLESVMERARKGSMGAEEFERRTQAMREQIKAGTKLVDIYNVRRGGRGKWHVFKGEERVSGGFDVEEHAKAHAQQLMRGRGEVHKLETAGNVSSAE